MMSKFTKEPWIVLPEECTKNYVRIRGTTPGGRYKVANVIAPSYEGVSDIEFDETRANAALISAAPEMYAVLSMVIEASKNMRDQDIDMDAAVELAEIVKAKADGLTD